MYNPNPVCTACYST